MLANIIFFHVFGLMTKEHTTFEIDDYLPYLARASKSVEVVDYGYVFHFEDESVLRILQNKNSFKVYIRRA